MSFLSLCMVYQDDDTEKYIGILEGQCPCRDSLLGLRLYTVSHLLLHHPNAELYRRTQQYR